MFENAFNNIDRAMRNDEGLASELDYAEQTSWVLFLKYLDDLELQRQDEAELEGREYTAILDAEYRWSAWAAPKLKDGSPDLNAATGQDLIDFVNGKLFPYLKTFQAEGSDASSFEYKIGQIFAEITNRFRSGYSLREVIDIVDTLDFGSSDAKHELSDLYEVRIKRMGNAGRNGGEYYTPRPLIRAMIKIVDPQIGETIYDGACGSAGFLCEAWDYMRRDDLSSAEWDILQRKTFYGQEKKSLAYVLGVMNMILQAKNYSTMLQARFAYSTNGIGWYGIDMHSGSEGDLALPFPTPQELWQQCFPTGNDWRERFGAVPFQTDGGKWQPRYYQHNAITAVLEAIAQRKERILLTLATGTGKTSIAFQIAWKLFQSSWNLSRDPVRRPRILFLADRNILADQAYNSFSAFPPDALMRIDPEEVRKRGGVPTNANIFFTIFQTFMTDGKGEKGEFTFEGYAPNFFDFIIIDECHRGGAKDESTWRAILEYFAPAVQLGLTATPKRDANSDTYKYFGDPVYSYALKEGIGDGFLTPFKVRQMASTMDSYTFSDEDEVVAGEIDPEKEYEESDFNTKLIIDGREKSRVQEFMDQIDQRQKTLVFCATQDHAARVRNFINQMKDNPDPHYCERVTADDAKLGEQHLREFQDNEKTLPTILTTSQKLSTGVDARNIRNIVLLRPIKSMIEFKQIIGRGTRTFDGKDFFTVYDFVKAYEHFNDPEWDGEPLPPDVPGKPNPPKPKDPDEDDDPAGPDEPREPTAKIIIKLADGKERKIRYVGATTYMFNGRPITAQEFMDHLFGDLGALVSGEDELREIWSKAVFRRAGQ